MTSCAELIASCDWTSTSLGPRATWPISLRALVENMLHARQPMLLFWGPDWTQFYNDAFVPSFGQGKHPAAMGQSARECWADAWPVVGAQLEAVSRGEPAWYEDALVPIFRNGRMEEVFWTYSYSPAYDDGGSIAGVLVIVTEMTGRVLAARRLAALARLTLALSNATTLGVVFDTIFALAGECPHDIPFAVVDASGHRRATGDIVLDVAESGRCELTEPVVIDVWPEPATHAFVARTRTLRLTFGLSPRLPHDDAYLSFLTQVAEQASGAVRRIDDTRELAESEGQLRQIIQTAHDAFIAADHEGRIIEWNPQAVAILGWSRADVIGRNLVETLIPESLRQAHENGFARFHATGKGSVLDTVLELVALRRDGREIPVELTVSATRTATGDWRFNAFLKDISDRKRVEQEVKDREQRIIASLHENEVLLQEVHHRVKNNLQVITSLMNMQARGLLEGPARSALEECQSRVHAIALVHEKLYQAENYASVRFSEYARSLAANVFHAAGISPSEISLEVAIDDLRLSVDKAIPCGLILNELIVNSLKHGFPDHRRGSIRVELSKVDENTARLVVADDGQGMPEALDASQSTTLGMRLVSTLARQLQGTVDIMHQPGVTVRVTFPIEQEESRQAAR